MATSNGAIADKQRILELQNRYSYSIDSGNYDKLDAMFTPDATYHFVTGSTDNIEALKKTIQEALQPHCARLDLPEEKITAYTGQLERILDYVDQLQSVNTEGVAPTTRAVEVVNATREDKVEPTQVREELLEQAPQREGDFFRVPKILAE